MYVTVDVDVDDIIGEIDSSDMIYELEQRKYHINNELWKLDDDLPKNILDMLEYIENAVDKFDITVYQKMEINKISERLFQKTKG